MYENVKYNKSFCYLKAKQKTERKVRDEASDAIFARYLAEKRKKDIKKQREDNARHTRSKLR